MDAREELLKLLHDTKHWASTPGNIDTDKLYSEWPTLDALLAELDSHLAHAREGEADFAKLWVLYAPTAGLSEVVGSDDAARVYLSLSTRFDAWYASVRPTQ